MKKLLLAALCALMVLAAVGCGSSAGSGGVEGTWVFSDEFVKAMDQSGIAMQQDDLVVELQDGGKATVTVKQDDGSDMVLNGTYEVDGDTVTLRGDEGFFGPEGELALQVDGDKLLANGEAYLQRK